MKKRLFSLVVLFSAIASVSMAQYYYIPHLTAGSNPGGLNTDSEYPVGGGQPAGWTSIDPGGAATPRWSSVGTIPFSFNFNGNPVSSFKASTTGVLTFDVAASAVPGTSSASLPDLWLYRCYRNHY